MAEGSATLHESEDKLSAEVIDQHRAIISLMEELEAVDWYDQRAAAATDPELRAILEHNRDEEKEHAMMALEWLRRRNPKFDEVIRTYLLTDSPITEIEEEAEATAGAGEGGPAALTDGSLGIGSLRGKEN